MKNEAASLLEKESKIKDENILLSQYMEIVNETNDELNPDLCRRSLDDDVSIKKAFVSLVDLDFPLTAFQRLSTESKNELIFYFGYSEEIFSLKCFFHAARLVFGQNFENYSQFGIILGNVENEEKYLGLKLSFLDFQKIEKLYNLKPASLDFFNLLNNHFIENFDGDFPIEMHDRIGAHIVSMLFLAQHYGETIISDVLTRSLDESVFCNAIEIDNLVKDWIYFKEYPLQWSLELAKTVDSQ